MAACLLESGDEKGRKEAVKVMQVEEEDGGNVDSVGGSDSSRAICRDYGMLIDSER